ncbi:LysR family transcriptional regulator [Paenibacillus sp. MMS20-IR301]|uniref:LysR family transcriptional regulator n=1 Tax=Paenibacillus sp. MMS20-IR301 TaxID=2895946 RepID=UPI0028E4C413|nr:LysR family transcriptional regulator [Paenibacillus sp. MMS20-IR301]WNS43701.1 LysR family transcriptional regulator [Paenibacillus sp. MMS20-IR301]
MNIHALRLFYYVAETGSVTKAAVRLNISQPAVTSQIKKFEKELGMPLFNPQGRGISLTSFGAELAKQAGNFFTYEEQIEAFVEDYRAGRKGKLRIAATYLPANFLVPGWAARFKAGHPEIEMVITTTNSQLAFEQLKRHEADVAFYGGGAEEKPDDIDWLELFEDELWFVVAPSHPYANCTVTLPEMMLEPFIMREEGSSTRARLVSLCTAYGLKPPQVTLQFSGLGEVIRSVMSGYGANFISSLAVREFVERKQLARVRVEGIRLKNNIAICTRRNESLTAALQQFIEICRTPAPEM